MNRLKFIQLSNSSRELFNMAKEVWIPFIHEVNDNDGKKQTDSEIINGLQKRINIQGTRKDMHFEIAVLNGEVIGIAMFAVDLSTVYGSLDESGYGTVMGFYIKPSYRRKGFGRMFFEHIQTVLKNDGADKMYVCPDSVTGIPFWSAVGFLDSGKFDPDDKKPIYTKDIAEALTANSESADPYYVICASSNEALFVDLFYRQNINILHGGPISLDEWKKILSANDDDERNFLICREDMPLAWLRINGLLNDGTAWISMLIVSNNYCRQGIGSYALNFSEKFVRQKGFSRLGIMTTDDNIPAENLYKKCGYTACEYREYMTGDGVTRNGYIFLKEIGDD